MDKEKFIETIANNQNLIFKICNSYCPDTTYRKDLEQEVILQLWKSMNKFDGRVKITTWIYKVALNTAISFYRKDKDRFGKQVDLDDYVIYLPTSDYDPYFDEKVELLYKLIHQLPKMDKALMLLYLDNYKQKEIAEILGITISNVATKISRIKKVLQEKIIDK